MTKLRGPINKSELGNHYEQIAIDYLQAYKIQLLCRNFHSNIGEIDIIFLQNTYVCFAEVRYRRNFDYGHPEETVNYYKQKRITYTAQCYLLTNQNIAKKYQPRFDILAISGNLPKYDIEWYQNAFEI
jgi:putative endonuclease